MAIGERIHFFRILRGMTQKYLGTIVGFPERSADVRLAQYETGTRKPKAELTAALAQALDVSPHALDVPDIDSYIGLMHTLFTLEDLYGLTVSESEDGEICLKVDTSKGKDAHELRKLLYAWKEQADKLSSEEISKDKYDEWRYHYPEFDTTQTWAKVPSQALSDTLVEMFQDKLKPDICAGKSRDGRKGPRGFGTLCAGRGGTDWRDGCFPVGAGLLAQTAVLDVL